MFYFFSFFKNCSGILVVCEFFNVRTFMIFRLFGVLFLMLCSIALTALCSELIAYMTDWATFCVVNK